MYITPARFRTMNLGNDLSGLSDVQLRSTIDAASQMANAYCAVPIQPNRHDFRGGTVVAEQHRWPLPDLTMTAQSGRRVYPLHSPIKQLTSFIVKFTNLYQVEVDPSNIYVDHITGWAEVVSIAAIVSGVYPVGINFGLYTPVAEIGYTYGWSFPTLGEVLSPTDATVVYQAANQFWDTTVTPVVYKNGVPQTLTTDYTVNSTEGTVTFTTGLLDEDVVTLDYAFTLPSAIAWATALLTSRLLAEADLVAKGLGNLASLRVEEVELRRTISSRLTSQTSVSNIDPIAASYLDDFIYTTVR